MLLPQPPAHQRKKRNKEEMVVGRGDGGGGGEVCACACQRACGEKVKDNKKEQTERKNNYNKRQLTIGERHANQ